MFACFACNFSLPTNKALLTHIRLHHNHFKIFRCIEESCGKSYSSLNSFTKHRKTKHSDPQTSVGIRAASNDGIGDVVVSRARVNTLAAVTSKFYSEEILEQSNRNTLSDIKSTDKSNEMKEQIEKPSILLDSDVPPPENSEFNSRARFFESRNDVTGASKTVDSLDQDLSISYSEEILKSSNRKTMSDITRTVDNSETGEQIEELSILSTKEVPPAKHSESNSSTRLTQSPNDVTEEAPRFVSKMFNFSEIPRKIVNEIVNDVSKFVNDILHSVEKKVECHLQSTEDSTTKCEKIRRTIQSFSDPFVNLHSEWQQLKYFSNVGTLVLSEPFVIGERPEFREEHDMQIIRHVKVTAEFIPMRKVLKQFFELPNVLSETLEYLKQLNSNTKIISNFVQGTFWKEKIGAFGEKTVLPLFLYFDDYENNNPLGSHKGIGKCGAVYVTIPCLRPTYQSKLENIFLFLLFNTLDRETFGNKIIFSKVVEELNFLQQTGIEITSSGEKFRLHFQLASIIGDNLGVHSIFGFVEGFRANYFCRFCSIHRSQINEIIHESQCELRNPSNYEKAVELNDLSQTGVKENCVFHDVEHFHVTKNLSVDVMHDVLEGVCPYDISKVLRHFIYNLKLFSLVELNNRIQAFYYGPGESNNSPAEIYEGHLKENCRLAMSSAEMLNFVRHICLILGCLVPEENEHWELLKILKGIVDIVCSTSVAKGTHHYLKIIITEYLECYDKLFPHSRKPKHHHLVHYSRIFQEVGVLWKISLMRYESKHREGKKIAKTAISRLNVCRVAKMHSVRNDFVVY